MAGLDRRQLGALLLASTAAPSGWAAESLKHVPALGSTLRLPDLPLLEGGEFKAASAQGKVVVVYWWASWCPFCALVTPHLQKLWQAQRSRGLVVLGLSIDQDLAAARAYRAKRGYDFPRGSGPPGARGGRRNGTAVPRRRRGLRPVPLGKVCKTSRQSDWQET